MITSEPNDIETEIEYISGFNEFKIVENKVIFNSKIIEIDGSIKNATSDENLILPISKDCVISHPAIKQIIHYYNLDNLRFPNEEKKIIFNRSERLIIIKVYY